MGALGSSPPVLARGARCAQPCGSQVNGNREISPCGSAAKTNREPIGEPENAAALSPLDTIVEEHLRTSHSIFFFLDSFYTFFLNISLVVFFFALEVHEAWKFVDGYKVAVRSEFLLLFLIHGLFHPIAQFGSRAARSISAETSRYIVPSRGSTYRSQYVFPFFWSRVFSLPATSAKETFFLPLKVMIWN